MAIGTDGNIGKDPNSSTGATLTTPTIINPTVTVDTLSEYTADNGVAIDGVKLKDGGALVITGGSNTFNITNGTASLDVASAKAVNIDDNVTVAAELHVEAATHTNQDLTSDATPTFAGINKVTITAPATSATLTVIDGTTFSNAVTVTTQGATADVAAATMYGNTHIVTGAYTLSLPTAAVGYKAKFKASTAAAFSLDLKTGTDVIQLNGTALAAGNKATTDGTENATLQVECNEAGIYEVNSIIGLAVDGGA